MSTTTFANEIVEKARAAPVAKAFGCSRNFPDNRFVYTVVSARARDLAIGVNMNPDGLCNFDCVYCEVNRQLPATGRELDEVPLDKVLSNILLVARQRPVVIQSLFPMVFGQGPTPHEIDEYILRLKDLENAGAQISLVQIYSATRPIAHPDCGHLALKKLSRISQRIKAEIGLRAEVF